MEGPPMIEIEMESPNIEIMHSEDDEPKKGLSLLLEPTQKFTQDLTSNQFSRSKTLLLKPPG